MITILILSYHVHNLTREIYISNNYYFLGFSIAKCNVVNSDVLALYLLQRKTFSPLPRHPPPPHTHSPTSPPIKKNLKIFFSSLSTTHAPLYPSSKKIKFILKKIFLHSIFLLFYPYSQSPKPRKEIKFFLYL